MKSAEVVELSPFEGVGSTDIVLSDEWADSGLRCIEVCNLSLRRERSFNVTGKLRKKRVRVN